MARKKSIKSYVLFWVIGLAVGMSLLMSFQSSQYFFKSFDLMLSIQMAESANMLPEGKDKITLQFGYTVNADWQHVPAEIKDKFKNPPDREGDLLKAFDSSWLMGQPKSAYFLMLSHNKAGEKRYISRIMREDEKQKLNKFKNEVFYIDPFLMIALIGLASVFIITLLIYKALKNLASPIENLLDWARNLKLENFDKQLPDFQYDELNALSKIFHDKMGDVVKVLNREKEFLSFASHELRTPIASLRSNASLLDKISTSPSPKELEVRLRIQRASLTMKNITETLLWLNRGEKVNLPYQQIELGNVVDRVVSDLKYLLDGKQVEVTVKTDKYSLSLPAAACEIIIANVIRNAFQHTTDGLISIVQSNNKFTVSNSINIKCQTNQANSGFGLGLILINRITNRFQWELLQKSSESNNIVTIIFTDK